MKKREALQEALYQFSLAHRILREDYGMGLEGGYGMAPEEAYQEGGEEMAMQQGQRDIAHYRGDEKQERPEEENTDMNLSKSDERIAQIREIALNGLQDYAQDVDCEAYQFYKKIWLMCDKAVSEKDSASNGGGVN